MCWLWSMKRTLDVKIWHMKGGICQSECSTWHRKQEICLIFNIYYITFCALSAHSLNPLYVFQHHRVIFFYKPFHKKKIFSLELNLQVYESKKQNKKKGDNLFLASMWREKLSSHIFCRKSNEITRNDYVSPIKWAI